MPSLISQVLIERYAAGPSPSKVNQVANLQTTIRSVLGETDYDTFLQGSYRNGTAIADINDVDIVSRRKSTTTPLSAALWEALFVQIGSRLRGSNRITGRVTLGNKCVKLAGTALNADIVPAVAVQDFTTDPVAIWSRRRVMQLPNYPRTHYTNGVRKQRSTEDSFKPTVRLFKRWARQYFEGSDIAPSFYIECTVHAADDRLFSTDLALSFARVAVEICTWSRYRVIRSVAGDKDILRLEEWDPRKFELFKQKLTPDARLVIHAIQASSTQEANRLWKTAFGDF